MTSDLVHVGYALMLCALVARDILWLRAILSLAQFNLCLYGASQHLAGVAFWNALFVVINVAWVLRILQERRAIELPAELRGFHADSFSALSAAEFLRVWSMGEDRDVREATFIRRGEVPDSLYFLKAGEAMVGQDGREIARLREGQFAAEMSLVTGEPASADVIAPGDLKLRVWPIERLQRLRSTDPMLWSRFQSVLGHDLVEKIRRASKPGSPGTDQVGGGAGAADSGAGSGGGSG